MLGKAIKDLELPREELVVMTKVRDSGFTEYSSCSCDLSTLALRRALSRVRHEYNTIWEETYRLRHYQPMGAQSQGWLVIRIVMTKF